VWALRWRRQCRQRGGWVVQFRATRRASGLGGSALSRQQLAAESAQLLRCAASTAGKGFGAQQLQEDDDEEWDEDVEEVDFGYAAEVVRETWELFAQTGREEQVGAQDTTALPLLGSVWSEVATLWNIARSAFRRKRRRTSISLVRKAGSVGATLFCGCGFTAPRRGRLVWRLTLWRGLSPRTCTAKASGRAA
jgi:hypothetical protein